MLTRMSHSMIYSVTSTFCDVCNLHRLNVACVMDATSDKPALNICLSCINLLKEVAINIPSSLPKEATMPIVNVPKCEFCLTYDAPAYKCSCGKFACNNCTRFDPEGNCVHKPTYIIQGHDWDGKE